MKKVLDTMRENEDITISGNWNGIAVPMLDDSPPWVPVYSTSYTPPRFLGHVVYLDNNIQGDTIRIGDVTIINIGDELT